MQTSMTRGRKRQASFNVDRVKADFEMFHEEPGLKIKKFDTDEGVLYLMTVFESEVDPMGNKRSFVAGHQLVGLPK